MTRAILLLYLIVLAVFDWKEQKIPLMLAVGGLLAAVTLSVYRVMCNMENWRWLTVSILLGMLPGIYMLAAAYLTGKAGSGDGITLLSLGMFTNYKTCILLWGLSMILMSLAAVGLLCARRANRNTRLPYLPFLTVAYAMGVVG